MKETKQQIEIEEKEISNELYNLDITIAEFIIPRLKEFRDITISFPSKLTEQEWKDILTKMINAFEISLDCNIYSEEKEEKMQKGLNLFAKYFKHLWI